MEAVQNGLGLLAFGSVVGTAICVVLAARNQVDAPAPKGAMPLDDRTLTKRGQAFKQGAMLGVTVFVLAMLATMATLAMTPSTRPPSDLPQEEPIDIG